MAPRAANGGAARRVEVTVPGTEQKERSLGVVPRIVVVSYAWQGRRVKRRLNMTRCALLCENFHKLMCKIDVQCMVCRVCVCTAHQLVGILVCAGNQIGYRISSKGGILLLVGPKAREPTKNRPPAPALPASPACCPPVPSRRRMTVFGSRKGL